MYVGIVGGDAANQAHFKKIDQCLEKLIAESDLPKKEPQYRTHEVRSVKSSIYEKIMREKVGTKVKIGPKKIEIPFDSEMDLERILDILGVSVEDSLYDV